MDYIWGFIGLGIIIAFELFFVFFVEVDKGSSKKSKK